MIARKDTTYRAAWMGESEGWRIVCAEDWLAEQRLGARPVVEWVDGDGEVAFYQGQVTSGRWRRLVEMMERVHAGGLAAHPF